MSDNRQPPIPVGLAQVAASVLADLPGDRGPAWLHTGAAHARTASTGFYRHRKPRITTLRHGLDCIAKQHPSPEYWGGLVAELDAATERHITAFWRAHSLPPISMPRSRPTRSATHSRPCP